MDSSHQTLKVIGTGLPRTGTTSLKTALSLLLGGRCFHGSDIAYLTDDEYDFWLLVFERNGDITCEEWTKFFKDYLATLDLPSILFYKELMRAFPEAKIVFSDRDEESWFNSWWKSIGEQLRVINKAPYRWVVEPFQNPKLKRLHSTARGFVPSWFDMSIDEAFSDIENSKKFYRKWKQEVINSVPADRLLIMRVEHGWPQLCDFLGFPVPSIPFPRDNESAKVQSQVWRIEFYTNASMVLAGIICCLGIVGFGYSSVIAGIFTTMS